MPQKMLTPLLVSDHVVNHFGQQHRLAHPGATEQAGLATAFERYQHVDGLDAGFKDLRSRRPPRQRRRVAMHRAQFDFRGWRVAINGVAEHIEHARKDGFADRCL